MKIEQISIFLENRAGRLAEVTSTLAQAGINIRALSLADTSDFGILRMIVCDPGQAQKVLKAKGFTVGCTSVVGVRVEDHPGGLDTILQALTKSGINVEYMYAFVTKSGTAASMLFRFDKLDEAMDVLEKNGFHLLTREDLCGD